MTGAAAGGEGARGGVPTAPVRLELAYRPCGADGASGARGLSCELGEGGGACGDGCLDARASFDGEVLSVRVRALARLSLEQAAVTLSHAFSPDERVLMNGYQSWTDTHERGAGERMRGLRGVPSWLVRRYVLDGGGDYRFTGYSGRRGEQHGFSYATFRRGARMELLGSLDESGGFTLLRTDARAGLVRAEPECPARPLEAGEEAGLLRLALVAADGADGAAVGADGAGGDGSEEAAGAARAAAAAYGRWLALAGVSARPARPLVGYTSWYRHAGAIDEGLLAHDLEGCARVLGEVGADGSLDGAARVFQIDDGYARVGDWLEPDPARFPGGMAPLAARIRAAGLVPGLWVAPFVCSRGSRLYAERPGWLLRDEAGRPVMTGPHWGGAFALDTRNPEVRAYVAEALRAMTAEWGFSLLKCDFLHAACMLPHAGLNRGQLMADALSLVREAVGEDVAILACGVPLASAFGRVEYCRVGCDVTPSWDGPWYMRRLHRERPSTRESLASAAGRAPLDGRAFLNDPDVFYLRGDVGLSPRQRERLLAADAALGSCLLTSDDMGAWGEQDVGRFRSTARTMLARVRAREGGGAR